MADILDSVLTLACFGLLIYAGISLFCINRRMNKILSEIERDLNENR